MFYSIMKKLHVSVYIGHHQFFYRLRGSIYLSGGELMKRSLCIKSLILCCSV